MKKFKKITLRKVISVLLVNTLLFSQSLSLFATTVSAATSPWSQTDWSSGDYSSISGVDTTTTAGQVTLEKQEKLTNTGFETDTSSWTAAPKTFSDSSFVAASGAVAAWPLDDTTSTQSYARVINPADSEGRDIVINGGFDSDTIWTKGSAWTITGGVAHADGSSATPNSIYQAIPLIVGKVYSLTYTVSNYSAGGVKIYAGDGTAGILRSANGTYTETLKAAGSNLRVYIEGWTNFAGDIDNVSVTQLNIPATPIVAASELLSDGNMEASGTSSWTAGNSAALSKQTTSPHGGNQVFRVTYNGVANPLASQSVMITGETYRVTGYARSDGTALPRVGDTTSVTAFTGTASTSWQPFDVIFVATGIATRFQAITSTAGQYVEFDDVSVTLDTSIRQGEVAINGSFDADTDWTKGTGWTIADGVAHAASLPGVSLYQPILVSGKTYEVTFTVSNFSSGTVRTILGSSNGTSRSANGIYRETIVASGTNFNIQGNSNFTGDIDDISVTEVSPLVGKNTNGVTLGSTANGHLTNAYTFDGTNDVVNIYSTDLNSVFNPDEGTVIIWAKVSDANVWGTTQRELARFLVDSSNFVIFRKTTNNNEFAWYYAAGGTTETVASTNLGGNTDWIQFAITWSKSGDQVKAFANGGQVGSTQSSLGTWAGNLSSTNVLIGASTTSGTAPWSGQINDVRLYNRALSPTEVANLYSGGTATRDTGTKYAGTASSKLISYEGYDSTFVQSVNVGTTETYQLEAYAYTDGSAVTTSDLDLYYNGSAISTTYTSVGAGWYKLTGTVTGANESRDYGVIVKAGKTVYVDNMGLWNYPTSATLTSSIFDSGGSSNWGTLTFSATTPSNTSLSVKVRSGNQADLSDATAFSSCSAIVTNTTVGGTSCVNNGTRYAQYQVNLASTDYISSSTFSSFSLPFTSSFVVSLVGPGNNEYTNNTRPTFSWNKNTSSDAVVKYILQIDRYGVNSIIVDNIPPDRSSDLETSKYQIHYDTNTINFSTKSSSDWADNEADGKLTQGRVNWKVTAVDGAGNQTTATRSLFVDTTSPSLTINSVNGVTSSSNSFSTNDTTPTIYGGVTDPTVAEVSSGVGSVEIKIEKRLGSSYTPEVLYTLNSPSNPFEYTPPSLSQGVYRVTLKASDRAGNWSDSVVLALQIGSVDEIITPSEGEVIEEDIPAPGPGPSSAPEVTLASPTPEITVPSEIPGPSFTEQATEKLGQITNSIIAATGNLVAFIFQGIGKGVSFTLNTVAAVFRGTGNVIVAIAQATGKGISFIASGIGTAVSAVARSIGSGIAYVGNQIGVGLSFVASSVGNAYNSVALSAPGVIGNVMQWVSQAFVSATSAIAQVSKSIALAVTSTAGSIGQTISQIAIGIGRGISSLAQGITNTVNSLALGTKNIIAGISFGVGQRTQDVSDRVGFMIVKFGYNFVDEPTTISDVKVEVLSPTSTKITWQTNHPATGKVNYGLDKTMPLEMQTDKRTTEHEFILENLEPDTTYAFEVMSQNKNYVYDANREFKTPKE